MTISTTIWELDCNLGLRVLPRLPKKKMRDKSNFNNLISGIKRNLFSFLQLLLLVQSGCQGAQFETCALISECEDLAQVRIQSFLNLRV